MDLHRIIKRPLVTEKSTRLIEQERTYAFEVDPRADKRAIAQAVSRLFGVTVTGVRTARVQGKIKRLGVFRGRRPSWKKALVTLKEGDKIELFEGA